MTIEDDRQIARFVPDRLPEFVRVDHPTLVAFLEAYYEWLGQRRDLGLVISPMAMHDIPDVDTTLDQFIDSFKAQYLFNFPESLAINEETGEPVDVRRLVKNIKQFYLAKGTEKSYEFLFRIFYDTNVEFYYPKKDILRLSSGRWIQNNYLRISNALGDQIYRAAGNLIVQKNNRGAIIATARVVSVNVFQIDNFSVAELLISGRNGVFQVGNLGIEFEDENEKFKEVQIYSVVSTVNIVDGGSNYRIGERIRFLSNTSDGGQGARGTIAEVDAVGGIRKINIDDFGINYSNPPIIEIDSDRGSGFIGTAMVGSLCQSFGYYANNDGRLSTNKVLQDNHYYQNWSYVLKSEVVIDTYRELIRRLVHPVGTGMFGSVLIKRCNRANLDNASALMSFKIPYIGNYVPYTFQTFDDLSVWFQGVTAGGTTAAGYSPTAHDSLIQQEGNGFAVIGNPITNDVGFKEAASGILSTSGFPNADPFWIVYPHPNKHVQHGYHYARVWKPQMSDFVRWREWIQNHIAQPNYEEFLRFIGFLNRGEYDDLKASGEVAFLMEGGIAGSCPCPNVDSAACDGILETCANSGGTVRYLTGVELFGDPDSDCCCCDIDGDDLPPSGPGGGPTVQGCKCLGGVFEVVDGQSICVCPYGTRRIPASGGCGWRCVRDEGGGGGGGGGCEGCDGPCFRCVDGNWCQPVCSPSNIGECPCTNCSPQCPDSCCPDGSCPPCALPCDDPSYEAENFCECNPTHPNCLPNICDIDPSWENCCFDDPCAPTCVDFCLSNPGHPLCERKCIDYPCCTGCAGRECNPRCIQFDPCLTTCPGFDYCITGQDVWSTVAPAPFSVEQWNQIINQRRQLSCPEYGPCFSNGLTSCFDKCTATGCSPGYEPCHADCNPDPCGVTCFDSCVCDDTCNQDCEGFDWCFCDPFGLTCCAQNPCLVGCNPDYCDPNYGGGQCFNPCHPSCNPNPCDPSCPGYGPCHPDCPEVPGDTNRRPCNPLCPGFNRCNRDCPNYDTEFCCQGCNCGDGGGVGDPVYRDNDIRRWEAENPPFNPNDNNPCNNDIATCLFGRNTFDPNAHLGTLLKYDESSEFRKITMRAFFNMPAGEAFDCREETVRSVALPQFTSVEPANGQSFKTEDPNRPLTVRYRIQNQENLGYYKVAQVNIYIDNRLRSTVSINTQEVRLTGIADGRRTMKMEMVDFEGNNVPGTQTVSIFGYQYTPPRFRLR